MTAKKIITANSNLTNYHAENAQECSSREMMVHSLSTKNCEMTNFMWFKHKPIGDDFYCVF